MTTGYIIRCGGCGEHAPLVGELLSDLSEQMVAFQADHGHADCNFVVDCVPSLIVLDAPRTLVAA